MYLFRIAAVEFEGFFYVVLLSWTGETQILEKYTPEQWLKGTPYNAS